VRGTGKKGFVVDWIELAQDIVQFWSTTLDSAL